MSEPPHESDQLPGWYMRIAYGNPLTPILYFLTGTAAITALSHMGIIPGRPGLALAVFYATIALVIIAAGVKRLQIAGDGE